MLLDTHCHIQFNDFKKDYSLILKKCKENNLTLITVGTQYKTSKKAIKFAKKYNFIFASVGLHPIYTTFNKANESRIKFKLKKKDFDYKKYKKLCLNNKVVAIGECGLDLFHLPENLNIAEVLKIQTKVFIEQFNLAKELNLPLIIHVREAHKQMIEVLKDLSSNIFGVIHCYTSNWADAQEYLKLGLYIGFTGIITFPPKKQNGTENNELIEVVKNCPLDKILIETDAPYLAPQLFRGKKSEPWMVLEVAKKIAEIKKISLEKVIENVNNNALTLFNKIKTN